jgi:hypothetical protein
MNRSDLDQLLAQYNVSPLAYCLGGGLPDEQYVLDQSPRGWSVYYSERGKRTRERFFANEDEACRYLLDVLIRDTSTRGSKA